MARPIKATVDYFPCDAIFSASIQCIENEFGNDGFCFWVRLLQTLCRHEYHYIDLRASNPKRCLFYAKDINMPVDVCDNILNRLAEYGSIDKELYEIGIIFSQKFIDRISDVYKRRNINLKTKENLKKEFSLLNVYNNGVSVNNNPVSVNNNSVSANINSQTKQNKIKQKEIKENSSLSEKISEEEREILKNYVLKKCNADNVNAYMHKLIKNGDYKQIIEEETKAQIEGSEEPKYIRPELQYFTPEIVPLPTEEEQKNIEEIRQNLRKKLYAIN